MVNILVGTVTLGLDVNENKRNPMIVDLQSLDTKRSRNPVSKCESLVSDGRTFHVSLIFLIVYQTVARAEFVTIFLAITYLVLGVYEF